MVLLHAQDRQHHHHLVSPSSQGPTSSTRPTKALDRLSPDLHRQDDPPGPSNLRKKQKRASPPSTITTPLPVSKRARVCISGGASLESQTDARSSRRESTLPSMTKSRKPEVIIIDSDSGSESGSEEARRDIDTQRTTSQAGRQSNAIVLDSESRAGEGSDSNSDSGSDSDSSAASSSTSSIVLLPPPSPPRITLPPSRRNLGRRPPTPDYPPPEPHNSNQDPPTDSESETKSESDSEARQALTASRMAAITTIHMTDPAALAGMFHDPNLKPCQPWRLLQGEGSLPTPPDSGASSPTKVYEDRPDYSSSSRARSAAGGVTGTSSRHKSSVPAANEPGPSCTRRLSPNEHPSGEDSSIARRDEEEDRPYPATTIHQHTFAVSSSILDILISQCRHLTTHPLEGRNIAFATGHIPFRAKLIDLITILGGTIVDKSSIFSVPMGGQGDGGEGRYLIYPVGRGGTRRRTDRVDHVDILGFLDLVAENLSGGTSSIGQ